MSQPAEEKKPEEVESPWDFQTRMYLLEKDICPVCGDVTEDVEWRGYKEQQCTACDFIWNCSGN